MSAAVKTDHGKVHTIVGADNCPIAFGVGADCEPRGSYCKCVDKLTSIDHC